MALSILFVDDDVDDYIIFEDTVKELIPDAKITYLKKGDEIDDYLEDPLPDIIFLDYNLPMTDGIECLKGIRKRKECDAIPVVFYSVYFDRVEQAAAHGANFFIVKQLRFDDIKSSIKTVLN